MAVSLVSHSPSRSRRAGTSIVVRPSTDIDDRKRAEAEVEQAYLRLAEAQRLSKTGSFITDLLADEHNWSEELCRIFEFDPGTRVTTEAIRAVFHPEDLPVYEAAFKRAVDGLDRDIDITYRIITPAGNVKHLHAVTHVMETIAGRPVFIGAIQDVTESKVAEEALTRARSELAHMARVTTLSALTASIGHEINQPISAVITSADACLRWLNRDQPDVSRAREAVMRIQEDGKRAAEIISHLKSFYRKDVSPQRELVSANDVVRRDAGVAPQRGRPPLGGDADGAGGGSTLGERRPGAVATGVDEPDAERDGGNERAGRRAHDTHPTRGRSGAGVGE